MPDATEAFRQMELFYELWRTDILDHAFDAMQDVALDGESQMKERLLAEESFTPWGRKRVAGEVPGPKGAPASREHAGRYEGGKMYNTITSEAGWIDPDKMLEARWGWQNPEDYFLYQEHGTKKITAAESIQFSLDRAEDILHGRLSGIV